MPRLPVSARILVCDDQPAIANLIRAGLNKRGQMASTAYSGQDAVEMVQKNPVDVVICDLAMPGINGWETGRRIRRIFDDLGRRGPRFILLTGWGSQKFDTDLIVQSGVDRILEKPVDIEALIKVIRDLVHPDNGNPAVPLDN